MGQRSLYRKIQLPEELVDCMQRVATLILIKISSILLSFQIFEDAAGIGNISFVILLLVTVIFCRQTVD